MTSSLRQTRWTCGSIYSTGLTSFYKTANLTNRQKRSDHVVPRLIAGELCLKSLYRSIEVKLNLSVSSAFTLRSLRSLCGSAVIGFTAVFTAETPRTAEIAE